MDRTAAEDWIRAYVDPVGAIETAHQRPWSTVLRVPLADGVAWFKACAPVQAFEPRLTAQLFARWPDRLPEVLGHDEKRAWLLLADAGTPIRVFGNPPETWLAVMPLCSELQRGEVVHAHEHLATGVPDLRGMSAREALRELARLGLSARMEGIGFVVDQNPPAGSPLEPGATCTLVLNRVLPRPTGVIGDQR